MNRTITDAGVAGLAVHEGRAELLEEIMTLAPIDTTEPAPPGRHRRVLSALAAVAAVAVVAVVAAGVGWLGLQRDEPRGTGPAGEPSGAVSDPPTTPAAPGVGSGDRAVLTEAGWTLGNVEEDPEYGGELSYEKGDQRLDVHWYPADQYDSYVADRDDIGPSVEVDLLGKTSLMWAYSRRDHTVIRPVEKDFWLEVRGSGMDEAAFRDLLGRLTLVGKQELQRSLPGEAVLDAERPDAIAGILADIPVPDGFDAATIESSELSRYHLIADVTGAVTCAWIEQFRAGRAAGDAAATAQAQQALGTAREWAALKEIVDEGDWSEAVWDYADVVVAGAPTSRDDELLGGALEGGLGCR
jgi:hypothetical protein